MILSQKHPMVSYYELEHQCSVEDIYNMLEIIDGKMVLEEEARNKAERDMKAKNKR